MWSKFLISQAFLAQVNPHKDFLFKVNTCEAGSVTLKCIMSQYGQAHFKNLQHLLQYFQSVHDHFRILCIDVLIAIKYFNENNGTNTEDKKQI